MNIRDTSHISVFHNQKKRGRKEKGKKRERKGDGSIFLTQIPIDIKKVEEYMGATPYTTTYEYDVLGNLTKVIDANNIQTTMTHYRENVQCTTLIRATGYIHMMPMETFSHRKTPKTIDRK